jgi:hypothetical protein
MDVWAERQITPAEARSLANPARVLTGAVLTREPHLTRALVTVDAESLWISLEVVGAGAYDADVSVYARRWFDDLWDAAHLGGHPDTAHLQSAPQLLALARANRSMDWGSAVIWAGLTATR